MKKKILWLIERKGSQPCLRSMRIRRKVQKIRKWSEKCTTQSIESPWTPLILPLLLYSHFSTKAPAPQAPTTKIPYYLRLLSYMLLDWAQILNGSGFLASVPSVAGSWGGRPGSGWTGGGGGAVSVDGACEEWRGESEGKLRWLPWLSFLSSGCCGHSDESMRVEIKCVWLGWELENRERWINK